MKHFLFLLLILQATAVSAETLYFYQPNSSYQIQDINFLGQRKLTMRDPWGKLVEFKRKSEGYFGTKYAEFGGTVSGELKVAGDRNSISWRFITPHTDSGWVQFERLLPSASECASADEKKYCLGQYVITPRRGDLRPLNFSLGKFWENLDGVIVGFTETNTLTLRPIDTIKQAEIFDLDHPTVTCTDGGVCVGQVREVRNFNSIDIFGIKNFEAIVAFSRYGILTRSDGILTVRELARTDAADWIFTHTEPVSCNDLTANQLRSISTLTNQSAKSKCLEKSEVDVCLIYLAGKDHQEGEDHSSCVFQRKVTEWVKSPLQ